MIDSWIKISIRILEAWFLLLGFQPSSDWDANDPACLRDEGPYRIITVQAHGLDRTFLNTDELSYSLWEFLDCFSGLPGGFPLRIYEVNEYESPYFGKCIYASIYLTA